ncbi:tetratricopeptide repeat protein [Candidatus Omnitrophota bacterium]
MTGLQGTKSFFLMGAILAAAAVLLFVNLDDQYLWQDEAETALLGVNILKFGVPAASDGKTVISQEWGGEFEEDYLWRWTPWMDKYLAAASIFFIGRNTFAARFPFALLGVLSVLLVYVLTKRIFADNALGILSSGLLVLSVPFLLFARQCRYYSAMAFFTLLTLIFFFDLLRNKRYAMIGFIISLTLLFHSNYFAFFCAIFSLTAGFLAFYFNIKGLKRLIAGFSIALLINIPSIVFYKVFNKVNDVERVISFGGNLMYYLEFIHLFVFSFLLLALFAVFLLVKRSSFKEWAPRSGRGLAFLSAFCAFYVLSISLLPWHFFRYMINLIPVFTIITACMVLEIVRSRMKWAWAGLLLIALIHIIYPKEIWPERHFYNKKGFGQLFRNYLYEITHDYKGPLENAIGYLRSNAKPQDSVFVSYGDLPVKFYADLDVLGGRNAVDLSGKEPPDWLLIRRYFAFTDKPIDEQYFVKNIKTVSRWFSEAGYERAELEDSPDILWENRPDPYYHLFRSPESLAGWANVQVFKKKGILQSPSEDVRRLNRLGREEAAGGDLNKASSLFNEAIGIDPAYPGSYYNLGYLYYIKGDKKEAVKYFKKTLEIDPHHGMARISLDQLT